MTDERIALVGKVAMTVTGPDGRVVAEVRGHNRVLKLGRGLAAMALAGRMEKPTFKILLGSEGKETEDDDLQSLFAPITEDLYEVDITAPEPEVDDQNAFFRLTTTFTAKKELEVAESGIQIALGFEQQTQLQLADATKAKTTRAKTVPEVAGRTVNLAGATALRPLAVGPLAVSPILYNRAVVTPGVSLRVGDRLTVTWTISFVAA